MEESKTIQIRKKLPDRSYTGRFINFIKGKLIKGEGESEAVFKDFLYVDEDDFKKLYGEEDSGEGVVDEEEKKAELETLRRLFEKPEYKLQYEIDDKTKKYRIIFLASDFEESKNFEESKKEEISNESVNKPGTQPGTQPGTLFGASLKERYKLCEQHFGLFATGEGEGYLKATKFRNFKDLMLGIPVVIGASIAGPVGAVGVGLVALGGAVAVPVGAVGAVLAGLGGAVKKIPRKLQAFKESAKLTTEKIGTKIVNFWEDKTGIALNRKLKKEFTKYSERFDFKDYEFNGKLHCEVSYKGEVGVNYGTSTVILDGKLKKQFEKIKNDFNEKLKTDDSKKLAFEQEAKIAKLKLLGDYFASSGKEEGNQNKDKDKIPQLNLMSKKDVKFAVAVNRGDDGVIKIINYNIDDSIIKEIDSAKNKAGKEFNFFKLVADGKLEDVFYVKIGEDKENQEYVKFKLNYKAESGFSVSSDNQIYNLKEGKINLALNNQVNIGFLGCPINVTSTIKDKEKKILFSQIYKVIANEGPANIPNGSQIKKAGGASIDLLHIKKGGDNGPLEESKALESGNSKEPVTGQVKVKILDPVGNKNNNPETKVVNMTAKTISEKIKDLVK